MLPIEIWVLIASQSAQVLGRALLAIPGLARYLREHNLLRPLQDSFARRVEVKKTHGHKVYYVLPNGTRHGLYEHFKKDGYVRRVYYLEGQKHGIETCSRAPEATKWKRGQIVWQQRGQIVCFRDRVLASGTGSPGCWRQYRPGNIISIGGETYQAVKRGELVTPVPFEYSCYTWEEDGIRFKITDGKRGLPIISFPNGYVLTPEYFGYDCPQMYLSVWFPVGKCGREVHVSFRGYMHSFKIAEWRRMGSTLALRGAKGEFMRITRTSFILRFGEDWMFRHRELGDDYLSYIIEFGRKLYLSSRRDHFRAYMNRPRGKEHWCHRLKSYYSTSDDYYRVEFTLDGRLVKYNGVVRPKDA